MQFMLQVPPESKPRFRSILEGAGRDCNYEAMFAELQEAVKSKKVAFASEDTTIKTPDPIQKVCHLVMQCQKAGATARNKCFPSSGFCYLF